MPPTNPSTLHPNPSAAALPYNPALSIWLSVDPLSDKYPNLSPYVYCADNPVRLVDVDGREIWIVGSDGNNYRFSNGKLFAEDGSEHAFSGTSYEGKVLSALNKLKDSDVGNNLVAAFENSDHDVTIQSSASRPDGFVDRTEYKGGNDVIYWNENGTSLFTVDGIQKNAVTDLGHEFSHAYDNCIQMDYLAGKYDGLETTEWMACYRENCIRSDLGLPLRTFYSKTPIRDYWSNSIIDYSPEPPCLINNNTPYSPTKYLIHP